MSLSAASLRATCGVIRCRPYTGLTYHNIRLISQVPRKPELNSGNTYTQHPSKLSQNISPAEQRAFDRTVADNKEKQARAPWMRDRADDKPIDKIGSVRSFAKGKLLTTPSRMLKLIIPLAQRDSSPTDREDKEVEPLALLVHPQQPLSYLERLVQSELPSITVNNSERLPKINFRAPEAVEAAKNEDGGKSKDRKKTHDDQSGQKDEHNLEDSHITMIDGKRVQTGKLKSKSDKHEPDSDNPPPPKPKEEEPDEDNQTNDFVRWSSSTEIGDFVRDAAGSGGNFAMHIEGAPNPILVGVPTFEDRTYYLRMRLRQRALEIARLAGIKSECDNLAQRGAKNVAYIGGATLVCYWVLVYFLTFQTTLGWNVMEPVTYLVGLSTLIGGYGWFLIHNRQVSYRSAMNFTISKRQAKLYDERGFNLGRWEDLMQEGNQLRREIKMVADEYNVEWNEQDEAKSKKVIKALKLHEKEKEEERKDKESED